MKNILIVLAVLFGLLWIFASSSCVYSERSFKTSFNIRFVFGSSKEDLTNFANDLKITYPGIIIENVVTDKDAFDAAVKFNNIKPENVEAYRESLTSPYDALPTASTNIKVATKDLGSEKKFKDFISKELDKYKSLKIFRDQGDNDNIGAEFAVSKMSAQACINPRYSIWELYYKLVYKKS